MRRRVGERAANDKAMATSLRWPGSRFPEATGTNSCVPGTVPTKPWRLRSRLLLRSRPAAEFASSLSAFGSIRTSPMSNPIKSQGQRHWASEGPKTTMRATTMKPNVDSDLTSARITIGAPRYYGHCCQSFWAPRGRSVSSNLSPARRFPITLNASSVTQRRPQTVEVTSPACSSSTIAASTSLFGYLDRPTADGM